MLLQGLSVESKYLFYQIMLKVMYFVYYLKLSSFTYFSVSLINILCCAESVSKLRKRNLLLLSRLKYYSFLITFIVLICYTFCILERINFPVFFQIFSRYILLLYLNLHNLLWIFPNIIHPGCCVLRINCYFTVYSKKC